MPRSLTIQPWPDPVLDTVGHDPRSRYVERFWLPILGPTAILLLRHLATRFEESPRGIELPVADTSRSLGLGVREGSSSPIVRTLVRLESFGFACSDGASTVAVRRHLPPADRRRLRRLPPSLQAEHAAWAAARLAEPPHADARRRARCLALTLLEQGAEVEGIEHVLASMGFHPAVSSDATRWAVARASDPGHHGGDVVVTA